MKEIKFAALVLVIYSILQAVIAKSQPLYQDENSPGQNQEAAINEPIQTEFFKEKKLSAFGQ